MNNKILCIETSSDACSVALNCNETIIEDYELAPCKHSQLILSMIQKVLAEVGVGLKQLDAIAFGCGPGSFTGIRLAASVAQGLALGLELPVMPISTLNIMAQGVYEEYKFASVLVGLDAKMSGIYWGVYCLAANGLMQPLHADKIVQMDEEWGVVGKNFKSSEEWFGVGNAWEIHKEVLLKNYKTFDIKTVFYPRAKYLLSLARENFTKGKVVSAELALPVYLHEQVVK